jgi:hypothetical protein
VLITAYFNTPVESIAALSGTTLATVLKECPPRQQVNYILIATSLYAASTAFFVPSVLYELLSGFFIVLTIKGWLII